MALTLHLIKNEVLSYEIVELEDLSGSEATIYSVSLNGDEMTLFDHFIEENQSSYQSAVKEILTRLQIIGAKTGAR